MVNQKSGKRTSRLLIHFKLLPYIHASLYIHEKELNFFIQSTEWQRDKWKNLSGLWELLITTWWYKRENQQKDNFDFKAKFPNCILWNNKSSLRLTDVTWERSIPFGKNTFYISPLGDSNGALVFESCHNLFSFI